MFVLIGLTFTRNKDTVINDISLRDKSNAALNYIKCCNYTKEALFFFLISFSLFFFFFTGKSIHKMLLDAIQVHRKKTA